jgi:hypothetical protein
MYTYFVMYMIDIHNILAHLVDGGCENGSFFYVPSNQSKRLGNKTKLVIKHLDDAYFAMHIGNCFSLYCSIDE